MRISYYRSALSGFKYAFCTLAPTFRLFQNLPLTRSSSIIIFMTDFFFFTKLKQSKKYQNKLLKREKRRKVKELKISLSMIPKFQDVIIRALNISCHMYLWNTVLQSQTVLNVARRGSSEVTRIKQVKPTSSVVVYWSEIAT